VHFLLFPQSEVFFLLDKVFECLGIVAELLIKNEC